VDFSVIFQVNRQDITNRLRRQSSNPRFNTHEASARPVFFLDSERCKAYVELLFPLRRHLESSRVQEAGSPAVFSSHWEQNFEELRQEVLDEK